VNAGEYYYTSPPRPDVFFQGDILQNFPVTILPQEIQIFRRHETPSICPETDLSNAFSAGPEQVVAQAYKTHVIILSQTCDIQQREFVVIAPIQPITQVTNKQRRQGIVEGRVNYRFWLPSSDVLRESFVELTILNSVPKSMLNVHHRILSLSDMARHHLAETLHRFFCRPFFPESA